MRRNAVRQKLGRDTYHERSVGVLGEEEQSKEVIEITYRGQSFQVFAYFGKSILFLSSHLTGPWILPKMSVQHFAKMMFHSVVDVFIPNRTHKVRNLESKIKNKILQKTKDTV